MSSITGAGTPESAWTPFLAALDPPPFRLDTPPGRAVVVAPHPDDEVLGVGGLLAMLAAAGTQVEVLAVTDGEASNPGGSVGPETLRGLRAAETEAALDVLGVRADVRRLRLPDGAREALEQPVIDALRLEPGDWLLAPWEGDGHPDHEAVGRGCVRVAARDGARLLAFPVWVWHWAAPGDSRVPWDRLRRIDLPPEVQAIKSLAVAEFVTQTRPLGPDPRDAPVLPPHVVARFARTYEMVLR